MRRYVYWADVLAANVIKKSGTNAVVASGITPSGPIHLGNLREVVTADAVFRALKEQGASPRLLFIADTFDPLRRVYPFLPSGYSEFVGKALWEIPDPKGCCDNYAEHFLKPFLEALAQVGIEAEVIRAHELYREGLFKEAIADALGKKEKIAKIMEGVAGRQLPTDWQPLMIRCAECGRLTTTALTGHREASHTVAYSCSCGHSGEADYAAGGAKLSWRVDWPARWKILGVTMEPFGKDHAASGGSYDTGQAIADEVFGYNAPEPLVYEWIFLKGKGAMASSTGVVITAQDMLRLLSPQVLRFLILRVRPEKHLDFDPAKGLLQTDHDYEELERGYFTGSAEPLEKRIYELSQAGVVPSTIPMQIPLLHVATVVQTAHMDEREALGVLKRTGYEVAESDVDAVLTRLRRARNWLEKWAPKEFRFTLSESLPEEVDELSMEQKKLLSVLAGKLKEGLAAEALHQLIHDEGKNLGLTPKQSFSSVYTAFLGRSSGPRAGWFLASLPRDFAIQRLAESSR